MTMGESAAGSHFTAGWYDVMVARGADAHARIIGRVFAHALEERSGPDALLLASLTARYRIAISAIDLYLTPIHPGDVRAPGAHLSATLAPGSYLGVAGLQSIRPKVVREPGERPGRLLIDLAGTPTPTSTIDPTTEQHLYLVLRVDSPLSPVGEGKEDWWREDRPTFWLTFRRDTLTVKPDKAELLAVVSARYRHGPEPEAAPINFHREGAVEIDDAKMDPTEPNEPSPYPFSRLSEPTSVRRLLEQFQPSRYAKWEYLSDQKKLFQPKTVPALLAQESKPDFEALIPRDDVEKQWLQYSRFFHYPVAVCDPPTARAPEGHWTFGWLVEAPDWSRLGENQSADQDRLRHQFRTPAIRPYLFRPRFDREKPPTVAPAGEAAQRVPSDVAMYACELPLPWEIARPLERPRGLWSFTLRFRSRGAPVPELPGEVETDWFQWWNLRVQAPTIAGLRQLRDSATASFLPRLSAPAADASTGPALTATGGLCFALRYEVSEATPAAAGGRPRYAAGAPGLVPLPTDFWPAPATGVTFGTTATFDGVTTVDKGTLQRTYRIEIAQEQGEVGEPRSLVWTWKDAPPPPGAKPSALRIGALEVALSAEVRDPPHVIMQRLVVRDGMIEMSDQTVAGGDLSGFEFLVTDIQAVGQDPIGNDENEEFCLVAPSPKDTTSHGAVASSPYLLQAEESFGQLSDGTPKDHALRLTLRLINPELRARQELPIDVRVLRSRPLEVARVTSTLSLASDQIALWSSVAGGRPAWQLAVDEGFTLRLPPQAIAEDTVDTLEVDGDPEQPKLPFRVAFGPPMEVSFRGAGKARRLNLAPWNLRDLLADPRDEMPGAWVAGLKTEILFGLSVTLPQTHLHLAELDASIGRHPQGPTAGDLELVSRASGFVPAARFESYASSTHATLESLRGRLRWYELVSRLAPDRPVDVVDPITPKLRDSDSVSQNSNHDPERVDGGVLWAIKSANIRNQAKSDAVPTGRLEGPAFTPLGGFGRQFASFNGGLSKITATVRMGRVLDYKFERLGRVAILGHKARYVVIYRRYASAKGGEFQGVAVVRKVAEYVEFLEKIRTYAEESGGSRLNVGPLRAAHFASPEPINVDARKGWDTDRGWVLPLTSRGDDPTLVLSLHGAHGRAVDSVVANPELLNFYTETAPGADPDPANWDWALGVDAPVADVNGAEATASPLRPGIAQFTFRLGSAPRVDVMAGRQADAVEARIESITLARRGSPFTGTVPIPAVEGLLRTAIDAFERQVQEGIGELPGVNDLRRAAAALDASLQDVEGRFHRVADVARTAIAREIAGMHGQVLKADEEVVRALVMEILRRVAKACQPVDAWREAFLRASAMLEAVGAEIDRRVTELPEEIDAIAPVDSEARKRLKHLVVSAVMWIQRNIARVASVVGHLHGVREQIENLARRHGAQLLERLRAEIERAEVDPRPVLKAELLGGLETLRAFIEAQTETVAAKIALVEGAVGEWEATVDPTLAALVDAVARSLPQLKVGQIGEQFDREIGALTVKIASAAAVAAGHLQGEIAELDGEVAKIVDGISALRDEAAALQRQVETAVGAGDALIRESRRAASELLGSLPRAVSAGAAAAYEQAIKAVTNHRIGSDTGLAILRAFGDAPRAELLEFKDAAGRVVERVEYLFPDAVSTVRTTLMHAMSAARSVVPSLDAFRFDLPVDGIGEKLLPKITTEGIGKLIPKICGLDLGALLNAANGEKSVGEVIVLKHGFDPVQRRAWLKASLDYKTKQELILIGADFLRLSLSAGASLTARAEVSADAYGTRHETTAQLTADWVFVVAREPVLTLRNAVLRVAPDGGVSFKVAPRDVRSPAALQFLNDLMTTTRGGDDSGLSLSVSPEGVKLNYGLLLPALQTGAFSVSGLALNAYLRLGFDGGFTLELGGGLSSASRPFVLAILFLGGGGWFTASLTRQLPGGDGGQLVEVGLAAGASVPFDIGVARGGVQFLVYASVRWTGGSGLRIVIGASLRGELEILSIISISVYVSLELQYGGGALTLRGRIQVSIKIFFFKINVSAGFEKRLAGGGGRAAAFASFAAGDAVGEYLDDFDWPTAAQGGGR